VNIEGNKNLKKLPEDFGNLENITLLSLINNGLERLPENFGKLKTFASIVPFRNSAGSQIANSINLA